MFARNLQSLSGFYLLAGLALCFILILQIRQIYDNKLKNGRYLGYKQFVHKISTDMAEVEKSVNKSNTFVHQLNEVLLRQHDRKLKNTSQSKMFFSSQNTG